MAVVGKRMSSSAPPLAQSCPCFPQYALARSHRNERHRQTCRRPRPMWTQRRSSPSPTHARSILKDRARTSRCRCAKSPDDTPTMFGGEKNPPIYIYDRSGPYSDPAAKIDIRNGLAGCARNGSPSGDTEALTSFEFGFRRERAGDRPSTNCASPVCTGKRAPSPA